MKRFLRFSLATTGVFLSLHAQATITVVSYWRMGEDDAGAQNQGTVASLTNEVGGLPLTPTGSLLYDTNVSTSAAAQTGSSLAVLLPSDGTSFASGPVIAGVTNNFGMEMWVKPLSTNVFGCIAYDGNTGGSGWGLYQNGGEFQVLFGAVGFEGTTPLTAGVWQHVAFVFNNGVQQLYVNGALVQSMTGDVPAPPDGNFLLGANNSGAERFAGEIDELRVFSFAQGQFSPNDLLVTPQPPFVRALPATGMSNTVATLNGVVIPHSLATTVWFQWGIYPNNNPATAPISLEPGPAPVAVSNLLTGLTPGMMYHGQIVASNALGVVRGTDVRFGSPAVSLVGATVLTNQVHTLYQEPGASGFNLPLAISAGAMHALVLKGDGTVMAWGDNTYHQTNAPNQAAIAISAGYFHNLAIKPNGQAYGWGDNTRLEVTGASAYSNLAMTTVAAGGDLYPPDGYPEELSFSLALDTNGTVLSWGYAMPLPAGLSNLVALAAGGDVWTAVRSDGTIAYPVVSGTSNVVAVAAGEDYSIRLLANGTVTSFGLDLLGGNLIPSGLSGVKAIAAGSGHSVALLANGEVEQWGAPTGGDVGDPVFSPDLINVVAIAAGGTGGTAFTQEYPLDYSLALRSDGTLVGWGDNTYGQTNVPTGVAAIRVTATGTVNTNVPGVYLLTYTASNILGGLTSAQRTVYVVDTNAPTTPPVITLNGPNPLLFTNTTRVWVDPGATAQDLYGVAVPVSVSGSVNASFPGLYTVAYWATDAYGHSGTNTRLVAVVLPPAVPGDQDGDGIVSWAELNSVYAQYASNSPWLYLTNVAGLGTSNVTFSLSNSIDQAYSVQYSTDSANWYPLGSATPQYQFTDTNAPALPSRFYRLSYP